MPELTAAQRSLIQKTWEIPAANPSDAGVAILSIFFEKYPHHLAKFYSFKNTPLSELKNAAGFRSHGGKIIDVFNEAVACLKSDDYLIELEGVWKRIGESHNKRKIARQVFEELRPIIVSVLDAAVHLDAEGATAWNTFLDIAYEQIFSRLDGNNPY